MNLPPTSDLFTMRDGHSDTFYIRSSRIPIDTVVAAYHDGETPEEIVSAFDTLQVADVYAIIAHYLRHQVEFDEYLNRRRERADLLRSEIMARNGQAGLKERLIARLAAREGSNAPVPHG